jgi:sarcosine oxidase/L-pipecolate oxidase
MAELATKAMKQWDALEKDAGVSLRWMGGLLNFGDKDMGGDTPEGKALANSKFLSTDELDRNSTGTGR